MSVVPVGLVQMTCSASKEENLTKAISKIREAAAKGAKIMLARIIYFPLFL